MVGWSKFLLFFCNETVYEANTSLRRTARDGPKGVHLRESSLYVLGLNECHTHQTKFWYLLGVPFKISGEYPRHFNMKVPTPVRGRGVVNASFPWRKHKKMVLFSLFKVFLTKNRFTCIFFSLFFFIRAKDVLRTFRRHKTLSIRPYNSFLDSPNIKIALW